MDDGCDVAPQCVRCPLPICRYEVQGGLAALERGPRDVQLRQVRARGASIDELVDRYGLSRRSIFRILAAMEPLGGIKLREYDRPRTV